MSEILYLTLVAGVIAMARIALANAKDASVFRSHGNHMKRSDSTNRDALKEGLKILFPDKRTKHE